MLVPFRHILAASLLLLAAGCATGPAVTFLSGDDSIDVVVDGTTLTTLRYGPEFTKPILHPLCAPSGMRVNRGFPLDKVEGEKEDHPHHAGLFFTYDEVNDDGFWNNTKAPPRIALESILCDETTGCIDLVAHWIGKSGALHLEERRKMAFVPSETALIIDFCIELTAQGETVVFHDTKEGMFALRVAHWLREDNGTGAYLSSRSAAGAKQIWGTRAEWVRLEGAKDGHRAGVAILNHPRSVNHPTYWHARAYGLFAANPLGESVFERSRGRKDAEPFALTLKPGESARFAFRVIVYDGSLGKEDLEKRYQEYTLDRAKGEDQ